MTYKLKKYLTEKDSQHKGYLLIMTIKELEDLKIQNIYFFNQYSKNNYDEL